MLHSLHQLRQVLANNHIHTVFASNPGQPILVILIQGQPTLGITKSSVDLNSFDIMPVTHDKNAIHKALSSLKDANIANFKYNIDRSKTKINMST